MRGKDGSSHWSSQTADCRRQKRGKEDGSLQTAEKEEKTADCRRQTAAEEEKTAEGEFFFLLLSANCRLPSYYISALAS
jgi:hypothetical protein